MAVIMWVTKKKFVLLTADKSVTLMENILKSLDRHVAGEKYHRIFRNRTRPVFHPVCIRRLIVIINPVFFQQRNIIFC